VKKIKCPYYIPKVGEIVRVVEIFKTSGHYSHKHLLIGSIIKISEAHQVVIHGLKVVGTPQVYIRGTVVQRRGKYLKGEILIMNGVVVEPFDKLQGQFIY